MEIKYKGLPLSFQQLQRKDDDVDSPDVATAAAVDGESEVTWPLTDIQNLFFLEKTDNDLQSGDRDKKFTIRKIRPHNKIVVTCGYLFDWVYHIQQYIQCPICHWQNFFIGQNLLFHGKLYLFRSATLTFLMQIFIF